MYSWFAQQSNPYQRGAYNAGYSSVMRSWQWDAHAWARQAFASNFTRGGFSSVAFASSRKDMLRGMTRHKIKAGSPEHIRRLHTLAARVPGAAPNVRKALTKVGGSSKAGVLGSMLGPAAMVGFAAQAAYTEKGPASAKVGAALGMTAGTLGWEVGAAAGASLGAAAGSFLGPVGTLVGAAAGYLVGGIGGFAAVDETVKLAASIPQRLVDRERTRRKLNWATPNPAFYTNQAATMRQASLQAMNRGLMTSRSAMGQEAMFVHS